MIFSSTPGGEVELEGGILTVRCRNRTERFDLASGSFDEAALQFWGFGRGTVLRLRSGENEIALAGEAYWEPGLVYRHEPARPPDVVLSRTHFEQILETVREGLATRPRPGMVPPAGTRTFHLWRVDRGVARAVRSIAVIGFAAVAIGVATKHGVQTVGALAAGLAWVSWIAFEIARFRRFRSPELAMTVADGAVTVVETRTGNKRCGPAPPDQTRVIRWRRFDEQHQFNAFRVALEVTVPPVRLSIGSMDLMNKYPGPRGRPPRYMIDRAWWPSLVEALVVKP